MKDIYILRAASGSGKSTLAESIKGNDPHTVIVCADDFFMKDGVYQFDPAKLGAAHESCRKAFTAAILDDDVTRVIVANTNTTRKEFSFYQEFAATLGHRVFFMVVENRHGNSDVHNVPNEVKETQKERLRNSLSV